MELATSSRTEALSGLGQRHVKPGWFHITDQALYDRECVYDDVEMRKAVLSGKYNFTEALDEAKNRKRKRKNDGGVVDEEDATLTGLLQTEAIVLCSMVFHSGA